MRNHSRTDRIVMLFVGLLVCAAGVVALARDEPRPGVDWPQFRGIDAGGVAEGFPLPVQLERQDRRERALERRRFPVSPTPARSSGATWCASRLPSPRTRKKRSRSDSTATSRLSTMPRRSAGKCTVSTRRAARSGGAPSRTRDMPKIKRHPKSTHASSTLATDGRHLVAMFGSEGLYAYDLKGNLVVEERLRRPGIRILPGAVGAVGVRELSDHPQRSGHRSGRRAQRVVSARHSTLRRVKSSGARHATITRRGARPPCTRPTAARRSS